MLSHLVLELTLLTPGFGYEFKMLRIQSYQEYVSQYSEKGGRFKHTSSGGSRRGHWCARRRRVAAA